MSLKLASINGHTSLYETEYLRPSRNDLATLPSIMEMKIINVDTVDFNLRFNAASISKTEYLAIWHSQLAQEKSCFFLDAGSIDVHLI